jgi:predicted MFS family arabinose efflux permease
LRISTRRARASLGVYRFWRDLGYAVGALLSGLIADAIGLGAAIHVVAVLTLASGFVVGDDAGARADTNRDPVTTAGTGSFDSAAYDAWF